MLIAEERKRLWRMLEQQLQRPTAMTDAEDDDQIYTRQGLIDLVLTTVEEFLYLCDNEIDLVTFAVELLEYSNGPRPEIEILPQGDESTWANFQVTLEPELDE